MDWRTIIAGSASLAVAVVLDGIAILSQTDRINAGLMIISVILAVAGAITI